MQYLVKLRSGTVLVVATALSSVAALLFAPLFAPVFAQLSTRLAPQASPQLSGRGDAQRTAELVPERAVERDDERAVQNGGADKPQGHASAQGASQSHAIAAGAPQNPAPVLDARQIMSLAVAATERSWQARDQFTYTELDEDKRLDSRGQVKSENVDFTKMILVNGARFDQLVQHNGQPPSAAEQRQIDENLNKVRHETPAEQAVRLGKDRDNRAFLGDLLAGFDFCVVGDDVVDGRPAYVIQVSPHPGFHASGEYGKVFNKVAGKIWVDKQDYGWIKLDGEITQPFSMGLFIARVQSGSRVVLEQTSVGDAVWVPKRLEVRGTATIFFFKTLGIDRILTYSDYSRPADSSYSVSR
jgi:hypothetical protein